VVQLTTDKEELNNELMTSRSRLMEMSIELGQLRDEVGRLRNQLQQRDQINGQWG